MMNIAPELSIWDLHIHTNRCPKMTSGLEKLTDKEYIDEVIKVLEDNSDVKMISFTDHNTFSLTVYKEYLKREHNTALIPGVEIDFKYEDNNLNYRQLIMYLDFDLTNEEEMLEFNSKALSFNEFMTENDNVVTLYKLFEWLDVNKLNAVFSPHAFKQEGKKNKPGRGLDADIIDEDTGERFPKLYSDQFFSFWESSGVGSRAKAEKYLRDFENEESVSIVSFSDSKTIEEFRSHIENTGHKTKEKMGPPQYFRSLPNFRGIQLVGVERDRIILNHHKTTKHVMDENKTKEVSTYISKVIFEENEIYFSDKLNTIIGGRGSGKSVLLDGISNSLDEESTSELSDDRRNFLSNYDIKVYSKNNKLDKTFKFDYFSQAHVNKLFQLHGEEFDKKLLDYFRGDLPETIRTAMEINNDRIINEYKNNFSSSLKKEMDNLVSVDKKMKKVIESQIRPTVYKKDKINLDLIGEIDVHDLKDKLLKIIPKQIRENIEVLEQVIILLEKVAKSSFEYNVNSIDSYEIHNSITRGIYDAKVNSSDITKEKNETGKLLTERFEYETREILDRIDIINNLINLNKNMTYEKLVTKDNNLENKSKNLSEKFLYTYQIKYETVLSYFERIIRSHISKTKVDKLLKEGYKELIEYYIFDVAKEDFLSNKTVV